MARLSTFVGVVLILVLSSVAAFCGEVSVPFPSITATIADAGGGTVRLEAPDVSSTFVGDPALPFKSINVLLPPDADVTTLKVSIRNAVEEPVPGVYDVAPCPPAAHDSEDGVVYVWGDSKEILDGRNVATYQTNAFYPAANAVLDPESRLGEYLLVPVTCWSYRYNPVTRQLMHLVSGDIVISFSTTKAMLHVAGEGGAAAAQRLSDLAVNYQDAQTWYGAPAVQRGEPLQAGNERLVIITTAAIQAASTELANFVTHKTTTMGMNTTVYTESAWGGGALTGDAAIEAVRNWLRDTIYNSSYKYYLLIVADPRQTSRIPMKLLCGLNSDYYFADITGNWDLNGNGTYGEWAGGDRGTGGIDLVPEFLVGRIPYYGSITDLDKILRKTINFEAATTVGSWAQRMLVPMVPANESVTFSWQVGEGIRLHSAKPSSRAYYRLYTDSSFPDSYNSGDIFPDSMGTIMPIPECISVSEANVLAEWQKGYGFVFWFTHGWAQGASGIFQSYQAAYLDDTKPAFTWQASCTNSHPDYSDNLAYSLLKNGAIGAVGATEVSLYRVTGDMCEGDAANQGLVHAYAEYIARDKQRAGDALFNTKTTVPPNDVWTNHWLFNLYGDPSVAPRWPTSFTIETTAIAPAMRSRSYEFEMRAAGSTPGYTWSRTAGSLPTGLTLATSGADAGRIYGTPSVAGTYTFTLQARSSSSPALTTSREFTMVVKPTMTITTSATLPRGNTHEQYTVALAVSGGTAPHVWRYNTVFNPDYPMVRLPPGLTFSEGGVISGLPTAAGTYTFSVVVREADRYTYPRTFSITITNTYITTKSLPIAQGGQPYSATLQADGGTAPYNWSLNSGPLPAGMSMSSAGIISGTPREFGNFTLTVRATDATPEYTTRDLSLSVLVVAYSFPMDTNPTDPALPVSARWTRDGSWAWGQPTGGGNPACPDPTSGYTGLNVCGYNLAGDYQNGMATVRYLTTGTLDLSGIVNTTLRLCRWLGVEGSNRDEANIEASPDGVTWSEIWSSFSSSASILDHAWSVQSYDLSSVVDLHGTAKLRWGMGETDSSVKYCGWNIDDVQILGVPSPTVRMGSVANARSLADGASCMLGGHVVTANFISSNGYFYIQAPGTHQGMRVVWPHGGTITVGKYILVQGTMQTEAGNGERYLAGDCLFKDTGTAPTVKPVSTALRSLGGSDFELQRGVTDGTWVGGVLQCQPAVGLGNLGCLVRVTGKVTATGSGYFYIDDGSRLADGTSLANVGVRVLGTLSSSAVGHQAVVTGIISGFVQDTHFMRVIRPTAFYLAN